MAIDKLAPIGIFDSGIGGLSILSAAKKLLPHESFIYFADSQYAPYGKRSNAFIYARSRSIAAYLKLKNIKALVLACNTATAHAIQNLREEFSIPIIGVEPGIKTAASTSLLKKVGVLATEATLRSKKFNLLLDEYATTCEFICQAGNELVPFIERGELTSPELKTLIASLLRPMLEQGIDTLVLGCTHFFFIAPLIQALAGNQIQLIDTSEAVARQLFRQLNAASLLNPPETSHALHFYSSQQNIQTLQQTIAQLLCIEAPIEHALITC